MNEKSTSQSVGEEEVAVTLGVLRTIEAILDIGDQSLVVTVREGINRLVDKVDKLQKFKDYVHERLDKAGVDKHEEQNAINGCRIGARLSDVIEKANRILYLPEVVGKDEEGCLFWRADGTLLTEREKLIIENLGAIVSPNSDFSKAANHE